MRSSNDCEVLTQKILSADPKLRKLLETNNEKKWKVSCFQCSNHGTEGRARAFLTPTDIVLCSNRLDSEQNIKEALTHEAIHAFDYTNNRCDFSTCVGVAYSEVRAARESECSGKYYIQWFRDYCIKSNAINSTASMFPAEARKCVEAVFEVAVADHHPIVEKPTEAT